MTRLRAFVLVLLVVLPSAAHAANGPMNASELRLALKKLTVLGSALYIAAHPDDENTAMLAWWANERLYRTAYLSITRGDGGQNLIGDEKGPLLGVIRTEELLAARRIDGAEQRFTRALDFGYSKTPAETLQLWGHDNVLADVVWVIRKFQPDVIVTRFPTTGEGGHGHHTASAMLAVEAFQAAGDPTRFPEQLRYAGVWQPKRIFWNRFSFRQIDPNDPAIKEALRIDLGAYNPLLGRAYTELAGESRSMHKSQGFGSPERRGSILNYFTILNGQKPQQDLFEGIDTLWKAYPGGEAAEAKLRRAYETFDEKEPQKILPLLLEALDELERLGATPAFAPQANAWIEVKRAELLDAIRGAAGLAIDVSAADSSIVPGGEMKVNVAVVNRSDYPFTLSTIASRYASPGIAPGKPLKNNELQRHEITIKLPADFPYSQPYWLAKPPAKGSYVVDDQQLIGLPENPIEIPIVVSLQDQFRSLIFVQPLVYRWVDAVRGEQIREVDVVPEVVANLDEKVYLFSDAKPRNVKVKAQSFVGAAEAIVRLKLPDGWKSSPASVPVSFKAKGDEADARFTVTPPAGEVTANVQAEVEVNGKKISMGLVNIEHEHIPPQRIFTDASARLVRTDIKKRGTRIGYIMGAGDEIPEALRQVGYDVKLLTDADLDRGDFAGYDAIVAGVRAYNTRHRLKLAHAKLLDWVKNGGTYVVQYNSLNPQPLLLQQLGPYPFKVTNERVTVEEAPVKMLNPAHPLLTTPNKITPADFEGWVQERGLYFATEADPQYQTMLATSDPGEPSKENGQLYAKYGKGVYVYTSYAWFRQLPAGVGGAYKMFVNLVSAK